MLAMRRPRPAAGLAAVLVAVLSGALASCGQAAQVAPAGSAPLPSDRGCPAPGPPPPGSINWSDEFDGPVGAGPDPRWWTPVLGAGTNGWGNGQLQTYTARPANVSLDGRGHLAITAWRERYTGIDGVTRDWTSARLTTAGKVEPRYGTVEARIQLPSGSGLWPAFWMLGSNLDAAGWPGAGEIDIMESRDAADHAFSYVHGPSQQHPDGWVASGSRYRGEPISPGWHTYTLQWSPHLVMICLDGVSTTSVTPDSVPAGGSWVFDHPFDILLNVAVGGSYPGPVTVKTPSPATMLVDYVRTRK